MTRLRPEAPAASCPATDPTDRARTWRPSLVGLLVATGASVAANSMVAVLVPLLVLQRTGSPAQAGLVGAVGLAAAVPALLLGGPLIDRWGHRRVAAGADLLSALAVLALPVLNLTVGLSLALVLALVAVGAVFDGPGAAARESSRPRIAAAAKVSTAQVNARGEATEGAGEVVGPALAGLGLGLVGALGSLWLAAGLLFVAAAVTWVCLPRDRTVSGPREPYLRSARAGLRLVWRDSVLRAVALVGTLGVFFVSPLLLVLAALLEPAGRGWAVGLVVASLAVGAVAGSLAYGAVGARWPRRWVLGGSLAAAAGGFAAMSAQPGPVGLTLLAAVTGVAVGPVNPVLAGMQQDRASPELLGRVVSVIWSLSLLGGPLGIAGAGWLLEVGSPRTAFLIIAGGLTATAVFAVAAFRTQPEESR